MLSSVQKVRRNTTVVATIAVITGLASTIFASASFGRNLSTTALWDIDPIVAGVPAVVSAGQDLNFVVAFEAQPEMAKPAGVADVGAAENATRNVTVYSDPVGVVSYSGTVTGTSAVIPAHVSENAAPGTVTIFVQTDSSNPATATTTVTGN